MNITKYVIGIDYGSDSVRSIIVDTANGKEISSAVYYYKRWKQGLFCNPSTNQFRQHPLDYIEGLEESIKECLAKVDHLAIAKNIKGISIDTTGSTPVAVDSNGTPLALTPDFEDNPNAMFVLWKDHTAVKETAEINTHAANAEVNYLQNVGGIYSSEWFWAKLLHILRADEKVRKACFSWVEHCDWIPFLLTGGSDAKKIKRSRCAAGHKALWSEEFGGLPPDDFFTGIDPLLQGFTNNLFQETYTSDEPAGQISAAWAERLGLPTDVVIGVGAFDAHMGAVGGQIEPYHLCKIMGTSTCDILIAPSEDINNRTIKGICGQVNGSVIPGMLGLEAGQSAFGDVYAWFKNLLSWPLQQLQHATLINAETAIALKQEIEDNIIKELSIQASQLSEEESVEIAIDWLNGRRTPDANQELKASIAGLSLASDAPRIFRALAEATCFGAKSIVERFENEGVPVKGIIGIGGVAKKSPYIMQMMADVLEMPIRIQKSEQTCALGAAMFAAVAAGVYPTVEDAVKAMGTGFEKVYIPNMDKQSFYRKHYLKYKALGQFTEHSLKAKEYEQIPTY